MKKVFLVWNLEMTECVGFESEKDAVYTSTGDQSAAEVPPFIPSLGYAFREMYAEGGYSSDYNSEYEDIPVDLITLPVTYIEIKD